VVVRNGVARATFSLSLFERTRVIELSNTRSGTTRTGATRTGATRTGATRTGADHVQAGTEDGFAPGP